MLIGNSSEGDSCAIVIFAHPLYITIYGISDTAADIAKKIVATDAFIRAIPSLDLVLTPNGFGIVSNNTVAPASKDYVDRLLLSLAQNRDFAIDNLLHEVLQVQSWRATQQGQYFLATLYQSPLAFPQTLHKGKAWEYFEQVHAPLVLIEQELAEHYISCEVFARLRKSASKNSTSDESNIIVPLQAIELDLLQGKPLPYKQLTMLVDYIRQRPDVFPEWKTSTTAKLYKPQAFENNKSSSRYWF